MSSLMMPSAKHEVMLLRGAGAHVPSANPGHFMEGPIPKYRVIRCPDGQELREVEIKLAGSFRRGMKLTNDLFEIIGYREYRRGCPPGSGAHFVFRSAEEIKDLVRQGLRRDKYLDGKFRYPPVRRVQDSIKRLQAKQAGEQASRSTGLPRSIEVRAAVYSRRTKLGKPMSRERFVARLMEERQQG